MVLRRLVTGGAVAVAAGALWWRRHPSACPYGQRGWVQVPHPFVTRARLREALALTGGERVLEVGPGTGWYSLPVAEWLRPGGGTLELADLQPAMLEHTLGRARVAGAGNVSGRVADAAALPWADDAFDAAFLTLVLGEVPDQDAALRELHRVLRPGGRLVVGELLGDPHWVAPATLRRRAGAAGFAFADRVGPPFGCFSVFTA